MHILCNYLLYKDSLHKIDLMSAFEMCHKIYLFELFCDKTFVPFLTLMRDHGRCSLTVNYTILTSLALALQNKQDFSCDENLLFLEELSLSSVRQKW